MSEMKIIIVDEKDNVIGSKPRSEINYLKDIYRVSALWVTNSRGEILIARRKLTKEHDPGKWSGAVAGTVEEGETYESNIYKEAEEEIGVTGQTFTLGPKQFISHTRRTFFLQWYFHTVDKVAEEFLIQDDEVEEVRFIGKNELIQDVNENPEKYVESMPSIIKLLFN